MVVALVLGVAMLTGIGAGPASADVSAVSGSAFGYYVNFGLFGGAPTAHGPAPAVTLVPSGGSQTDTDPDGASAVYGPARVFESSGPMTVHTEGAPGPAGSSTSSAEVKDIQPNDPFTAAATPGSPDAGVSSTCTATGSALTGSTTITNGHLVLADPDDTLSGEPGENIVVPPVDPVPNTQYRGVLSSVGDTFRIVFNEQVLSPDAITVNAVHIYMTGPLGIGEMIVAQSHCDVTAPSANGAPVAGNDAYSTDKGQPLTVPAPGLLANDSDPEGGPLTVIQVLPVPPPAGGGGNWVFPGDPAHGTLTLGSDGSFVYVPTPGFTGTDSFRYVIHDARGAGATATVTMMVNRPAVNTPPVARDDAYTINQDTAIKGNPPGVLANDTDFDTDALTAGAASDPAHGVVSLRPDGSFDYTPDAGFGGTDTFTYVAGDGIDSSTATVTITVVPRPVVANDNFAAAQLIMGASGSVTGTNVGATREAGEPDHAYIGGTSSIWYQWTAPATATFVFDTCPSSFDTALAIYTGSSVATLATVAFNNDAPGVCTTGASGNSRVVFTATAGTAYRIAVDGYEAQTGDVSLTWSQATPPPNDDFSAAQVISGPSGSVTGSNVAATQEPGEPMHAGLPGRHSIWYDWTAPTDGGASFQTCGSEVPTVVAVYTGATVGALAEVASSSDNSYDGCPFLYGTFGTRLDFPATAGVRYHIAVDGTDQEANGEVALTWSLGVPRAGDDVFDTALDTPLTVGAPGVLANDDANVGTLTVAVAADPASGSVALGPDGSFVYTPGPGFEGTDQFTYTATNSIGLQDTATVQVNIVKTRVVPDFYSATSGTPLTVGAPGVLGNDSHAGTVTLTAAVAIGPAHGTVILDAEGSFTYSPAVGFRGTDTFTYTGTDDNGATETAAVTITVVAAPATLTCKVKSRQPSGSTYLVCRLFDRAGVRRVNVVNTKTNVTEQSFGLVRDTRSVMFEIRNHDPHRVTATNYAGSRVRFLVASDGTVTPL